MADVASLVFDIDSSGTRTAASDLIKLGKAAVEVSNKADRLNKAVRDSSGRFLNLGDSIGKNGAAVSEFSSGLNTAAAATLKLQQYQIRLNEAVGLGVATEAEAAALLKEKHSELQRGLVLSRQAEDAARELASEEQRRVQTLHQLNSAYTPLYAASKKYEGELELINNAMQRGYISSGQHSRMLETLNSRYASVASGASKAAKQVGVATHQVQNMGYQITDIAVQLAGGQNPFLVIAQQLPQMIGGLGLVGAIIGTTTAVVGALATKFIDGANGAKKFEDALSIVSNASEHLRSDLMTKVPASFDALLEKYGSLNESVRQSAKNIDELNAQLIRTSQVNITGLWSDKFGAILSSRLSEIRGEFNTTYAAASVLEGMFNKLDSAKGPKEMVDNYDKLIKYLIDSAGGIKNMTAKQIEFVIELENGREQANLALSVLEKYESPISAADAAANGLLGTLYKISSVPFPAWYGRFKPEDMGLGEINGPKGVLTQLKKFDTSAVFGRFKPEDMGLGSIYAPTSSVSPRRAPNGVAGEDWGVDKKAESAAKSSAKKAATAAASELKAATKGYQSLRELMEQDSMFQVAEWEKRQAQLDLALNKRLITETKYAELTKQLKALYFGSEYEQNAINYQMSLEQLRQYKEQEYLTEQQYAAKKAQLQWEYTNQSLDLNSTQLGANLNGLSTYFGQANAAAGGGYAGLLKAQQSFAAASAFISAYSGAAQALGDPTLTTFQKIAAAGKVLTTGLGFVNAIKGAGSGGGGGGAGGTSSAVATQARAEPEKTTLVRVNGPDWLVAIADDIMKQIYKETKNGRVVVAGYNG